MKTATLKELADLTDGFLTGDVGITITDVAPLHQAEADTISFYTADKTMQRALKQSKAGALVVPEGFTTDLCPTIQVKDVLAAFEKITLFFRPARTNLVPGISKNATIADSALVDPSVRLASGVVVGEDVVLEKNVVLHAGVVILDGSKIGEGTVIFPNAVLYEQSQIGKNCILHANCVIGAYGFGYESSSGIHRLSCQLGNVVLEDNVEVGACSTIDRGTYGSTVIGEGSKLDNLVMVAHNCRLGRYNLICAGVGIAGSTTTGDYVVMAGRVGVRDHIHIGDGAVIGAMAGIMAEVPPGARVVGIPATPEKQQMKMQVALSRLPEMRQEFRTMQKQIEFILEKLGE